MTTCGLALFVMLTDMAIYALAAERNIPIPDRLFTLIIIFSSAIAFNVVGLFIGLAYGSGEGDLRESDPGKLTSLGALVTGRLFSQNVSRAVLIGRAIGG